jgi:hypothetical protein
MAAFSAGVVTVQLPRRCHSRSKNSVERMR